MKPGKECIVLIRRFYINCKDKPRCQIQDQQDSVPTLRHNPPSIYLDFSFRIMTKTISLNDSAHKIPTPSHSDPESPPAHYTSHTSPSFPPYTLPTQPHNSYQLKSLHTPTPPASLAYFPSSSLPLPTPPAPAASPAYQTLYDVLFQEGVLKQKD